MISQAMLVTVMLLLAKEISSASKIPPATCPTSCGNLTIPFPFGTSSDCSLDDSFLITCNHNYTRPFLKQGSIEVLDISLDGLMRVASSVASDCYDSSGSQISHTISELTLSKFQISSTRNKLTTVGCDTFALVNGSEGRKQMSAGCVSWCYSIDRVVNGTCSGIGCCQSSIPEGVKDILVDIRSFRNHTSVNSFNPCGYAFVVEAEAFEFSSSDLTDRQNRRTVPVVLDWSVGNVSCQEAQKNLSRFACRAAHSVCSDSGSGEGYHCKCLTGFEGNPYLVDGCHDIDECVASKPCEGTCTNLPGSYSCSCPKGFEGDGKKNGEGCHPKSNVNGSTLFYIASGFVVPAIGSSWIFWRRKQKKVVKLRRNLFLRNGGLLLEDMLSRQRTVSIFTAEDVKKATNNYNESNFLSSDEDFGISYKGMLPDGRMVTIMRCDTLGECNIEEFIGNIIIRSRIDHRNAAKLLGCCLETQVPLLVYEYFELETLYDYIHDDRCSAYLSWDIRLRIAEETARTLEYMHSHAGIPIIHEDLSSCSILLQHDHTVKVHFTVTFFSGSSGVIRRGRMGYMDPELFLTGRVTVKSNVYSFGVILAELLTGMKVIGNERPEGEVYLAEYFVSSSRGDNLRGILDHRLEVDGKIDQLTEVAKIAERCLSASPADRPTMSEVVIALGSAINSSQERTARRVVRRNGSF